MDISIDVDNITVNVSTAGDAEMTRKDLSNIGDTSLILSTGVSVLAFVLYLYSKVSGIRTYGIDF